VSVRVSVRVRACDHLAGRDVLDVRDPGGRLELLLVERMEDGGGQGGVALHEEG
jgi:hypothetical protein